MTADLKNINTRKAHALEIFKAGLKAVAPGNVIRKHCRIQKNNLTIGSDIYDLSEYKNIMRATMILEKAAMTTVFSRPM